MRAFSSIVIQPDGESLDLACKLDHPVFKLRELPIREQYKKALRRVEEKQNPGMHKRKPKQEQSLMNMMVSNKGSSLDMQKQLIQLLLGQKMTKGI